MNYFLIGYFYGGNYPLWKFESEKTDQFLATT